MARPPVGFRPPLTSVLPMAAVLVALALVFRSANVWAAVAGLIGLFTVLRFRQLLVLHDDHLEVTVLRRRRIPWSQVQGFAAGTSWRGGTQIETSGGVIHAIAPCSWWGGPAAPEDLETLRRELRARSPKSPRSPKSHGPGARRPRR